MYRGAIKERLISAWLDLRKDNPAGLFIISVGLSKKPVEVPPLPAVTASKPISLVPFCAWEVIDTSINSNAGIIYCFFI
jgi:hypothetical protein